jgi:molybdenum cofactor cytidylyltransferase
MTDTGIIILAAGASTRMGQSKQLLPVSGYSLLSRIVKISVDTGLSEIVVVLGSNDHAHEKEITSFAISIVQNPEWQTGMGSSLKAGLKFLTTRIPVLEGVVITVCDQPLLTTVHIESLLKKHLESRKGIIASGYASTVGTPVFFSKKYFADLLNLKNDEGAKKIILQNPSDTTAIDFPGGEIDLDTMDDYYSFINKPS